MGNARNLNLRFIFVQLLFSLAIGQVAIKISDLVVYPFPISSSLYVYSHLLLCIVVLSTSWVGFQISSTSTENPLNSVFSFQYLILLIDILLVITYFIIVRGSEIANYPKDGAMYLKEPDIFNETFWSMIIFGIYLIWDFLTKVPKTEYRKDNSKYWKFTSWSFELFYLRCSSTVLCFSLSLMLFFAFNNRIVSPNRAVLTDFALISLFFLFRGMKQKIEKEYEMKEEVFSKNQQDVFANDKASYPISVKEKRYMIKNIILRGLPLVCFIVFFILFYYN